MYDMYMKITCIKCQTPKEETEFYRSRNANGITSACKNCLNNRHYERRRERRIERGLLVKFPTLANRQLLAEGKKYCPTCKQIKSLTDFSTMQVRNGIASHCLVCNANWSVNYSQTDKGKLAHKTGYLRNRDKVVEAKLKRKFGISLSEYNLKLKKQNGRCAICGKTPEQNRKMLAVDHNHVTGKNRGLLCSSCNICIGFIEKNLLDFSAISGYLLRHGVSPHK